MQIKSMRLKILSCIFTFVCALLICFCVSIQNANASESSNSDFYDKLCKLEGVHDVKKLNNDFFNERYSFKITQQLD